MSSQETAAPPPATPNVRRLTRRTDKKWIGGVCAGLGDYTGLDPIIFRLAFVALAVLGGSGILLYVLAWLLIPEAGSEHAHAHDLLKRFEKTPWIGVALVIAGGALLLSQTGLWQPPIVWGCALIVLGFILFREHESTPPDPAVPASRAPSTGPSAAVTPYRAPATPYGGETTAVMPAAAVAPRKPPRPRSALGWYTIAACLVALGIAALLDTSNAIHLTLTQYLALPVAIIGVGLIVGAWMGRSRILILLGLLLVPFVLVASLVHVPLTGGQGRFFYRPQRVSDMPATYHIAAGELTLDLTRLSLGTSTTKVTATVGAGQLRVLVPPRVPVSVDGRAGIGTVQVFGRQRAGTSVRYELTAASSAPGLSLHLETGLGDVTVERPGRTVAIPLPKP